LLWKTLCGIGILLVELPKEGLMLPPRTNRDAEHHRYIQDSSTDVFDNRQPYF